jgi:hypothetical protein
MRLNFKRNGAIAIYTHFWWTVLPFNCEDTGSGMSETKQELLKETVLLSKRKVMKTSEPD